MNDYISRDAAICVADYAADEHPYDKDPAKPETFSEYNQGWNDACDYIRDRLEIAEKPMLHRCGVGVGNGWGQISLQEGVCAAPALLARLEASIL